jgi:hypothetical protein
VAAQVPALAAAALHLGPPADALARLTAHVLPALRHCLLDCPSALQPAAVDAFIATVGEIVDATADDPSPSPTASRIPFALASPASFHALCRGLWDIVAAVGAPDERYVVRVACAPLALGLVRALRLDSLWPSGCAESARLVVSLAGDTDTDLRRSVAGALRLWPADVYAAGQGPATPLEAEAQALLEGAVVALGPTPRGAGAGGGGSQVDDMGGGDDDDDDDDGEFGDGGKMAVRRDLARALLPLAAGSSAPVVARTFVPLVLRLCRDRKAGVALQAYGGVGPLLSLLAPAADACILRRAGLPGDRDAGDSESAAVEVAFDALLRQFAELAGGDVLGAEEGEEGLLLLLAPPGGGGLEGTDAGGVPRPRLAWAPPDPSAGGGGRKASKKSTKGKGKKGKGKGGRTTGPPPRGALRRETTQGAFLHDTRAGLVDGVGDDDDDDGSGFSAPTLSFGFGRGGDDDDDEDAHVSLRAPPASPATDGVTLTGKPTLALDGLCFTTDDDEEAAAELESEAASGAGTGPASLRVSGALAAAAVSTTTNKRWSLSGIRIPASSAPSLLQASHAGSPQGRTEGGEEDNNDDASDAFSASTGEDDDDEEEDGAAGGPGSTDEWDASRATATLTEDDAGSLILFDADGAGSFTTGSGETSPIIVGDDDEEDEEGGRGGLGDDLDLLPADVVDFQYGDPRQRRAEAVARALPGVTRSLLAPAEAVLDACAETGMGAALLDGARFQLHRHRARAVLVYRLRTLIRVVARLYRGRDTGARISPLLTAGLHEVVASMLVATRAIANLSAHISAHPQHLLLVAPLPPPPAFGGAAMHRLDTSGVVIAALSTSSVGKGAGAARGAVLAAAAPPNDFSGPTVQGSATPVPAAAAAAAAAAPATAPGTTVRSPVAGDELSRLTEARVCDVAAAVLVQSLRRREELVVDAALWACGRVLPVLEESRHERILLAMLRAAPLPSGDVSAAPASTSSLPSPSAAAAAAAAGGGRVVLPSSLSVLSGHGHSSSHPSHRRPRWTVADNVGWRLRCTLVRQFPLIVPVLSARLLVLHVVPFVLRMVSDPVAEVRAHASDALAVALGALRHFSERPAPLDELRAAHIKRASARLSAATVTLAVTGLAPTDDDDEGTPSPLAEVLALPAAADEETIAMASRCLESTLRDLTAMVGGEGGGSGSGSGSGGKRSSAGPSLEGRAAPGSHTGRVAYAAMCKAIFGIRDRHAVAVDGVSVLAAQRSRSARESEGDGSGSSEGGDSTAGAGGEPVEAAAPPAPALRVFDPAMDPLSVLVLPCARLAPAATAFVCAQALQPQVVVAATWGSGVHGSSSFSSAAAAYGNADGSSAASPLPRWWRARQEAVSGLYALHGASWAVEPGAAARPAAAATAHQHHGLPPELRAALASAQPHAPKLRTAEQLRRAACGLYDTALKLPLLRLLRFYRPGSYWWAEIAPLAGGVAESVAEREWRPVLQREALDRHLASRIRKQRWEEEEQLRASGRAPAQPVIKSNVRVRAWSGVVLGAVDGVGGAAAPGLRLEGLGGDGGGGEATGAATTTTYGEEVDVEGLEIGLSLARDVDGGGFVTPPSPGSSAPRIARGFDLGSFSMMMGGPSGPATEVGRGSRDGGFR